jgi:hypothetical protein
VKPASLSKFKPLILNGDTKEHREAGERDDRFASAKSNTQRANIRN